MRNTLLSIYHNQKGREGPPITFNFPEPDPDGSVHLGRISGGGKGWQSKSLVITGIGRLLCYRQYQVSQPVTFINEPSEPVVCLRLSIGKKSTLDYQGEKKPLSLGFLDNRIFWQGDRITENRIWPDEYTLLELYYRPECLSHLADRKSVMDIIDQSLGEKSSPLDHYVFSGSKELDNFILDILHELDTMSISIERFHYLCDCLFLRCIGEKVQVDPRPDMDDEQPQNNNNQQYQIPPEEQKILSELEDIDRAGLLEEVNSLLAETQSLSQKLKQEYKLHVELKKIGDAIRKPTFEKLGADYMRAARILATWHKKDKGLANKERKFLKQAILSACLTSFNMRRPTRKDLDFYEKLSGKQHTYTRIEHDAFKDFLSLLLPSSPPTKLSDSIPADAMPAAQELFLEHLREAFGLKSLEEIKRQTDKEKPKEVSELYETLMDHYSDTLELGKNGEIVRSDIVRELDNAYQRNDLLTLLLIESESIALDPEYISKLNDDRLRWLITSLRLEREDQQYLLHETEESLAFYDLQRFHHFGDDFKKFRRQLKNTMKKMAPYCDKFSELIADITAQPSALKAIILAECIIESKKQ